MEREFAAITVQVLLTHRMIDAVMPALHQREERFSRVRVNDQAVSANANIFLRRVIDALVFCKQFARPVVGIQVVRHQRSGDLHVPDQFAAKRRAGHIRQRSADRTAIALDQNHDRSFLRSASALAGILNAGLPADVSFISLHDSAHLRFHGLSLHCESNAMAQKPRRVVRSESKIALQLEGAHSLLGRAEHVPLSR